MKVVLVTGAAGFIGRHCLLALQNKGYEVHAVSSRTPSSVVDGVHWVQYNLLTEPLRPLLNAIKPSHLLHLAWITTPGKLWDSIENLDWLKMSLRLIESFVEEGGKRAVFAGTCAEYDWNFTEFLEEKTPCIPNTLYGSSKYALYLLVQSLAKKMNLSQAWGRIFYLYGPNEHFRRFIPAVIQGVLQKRFVPCSACTQIKDLLHVQDVADAFVTLLDSELQGAVNIGSGVGVSLMEVIEKVTSRLGGKEFIQLGAIPSLQYEPPSLVANTKKLKNELGWSPSYSLDEGLEDTISWWRGQI